MQGVLQNMLQQRIDLETSPGAHLQAPAGAQLLGGVAEWYYPCGTTHACAQPACRGVFLTWSI